MGEDGLRLHFTKAGLWGKVKGSSALGFQLPNACGACDEMQEIEL